MSLTDRDKARMFDQILTGEVTGLSILWREFKSLQGQDQSKILSNMAKFAAIEAIENLESSKNLAAIAKIAAIENHKTEGEN